MKASFTLKAVNKGPHGVTDTATTHSIEDLIKSLTTTGDYLNVSITVETTGTKAPTCNADTKYGGKCNSVLDRIGADCPSDYSHAPKPEPTSELTELDASV